MKLKYEMMYTEIEGENVALPVGEGTENFKGLLKMNDTARDILELLKEETDMETLTKAMLEMYEVDESKLRIHIRNTVEKLAAAGLLQEDSLAH